MNTSAIRFREEVCTDRYMNRAARVEERLRNARVVPTASLDLLLEIPTSSAQRFRGTQRQGRQERQRQPSERPAFGNVPGALSNQSPRHAAPFRPARARYPS